MRAGLDHLVHFIHRPPAEATEQFRRAGYHAVAGGRHEAWGTWNSLSYVGLSYVEFLAVEDEGLASQSDNPLIRQLVMDREVGEGPGQIALRTTEMDVWIERLRAKNLNVLGPVLGSRKREDGSMLRWRMLFVEDPNRDLRPPFFIEWQQTDEEREEDLRRRTIIAPHPNGAHTWQSVGYTVSSLEEASRAWQYWLDCPIGDVFIDERIGARCQAVELAGASIILCEPITKGLADDALQARGQRPFFATFDSETDGQDVICGGTYMRSKQ